MQVTVAKVRTTLEKLDAKYTDETKSMMLEMIRKDGPSSRAGQVMQALKQARSTAEASLEFVEALHDQEATVETLRSRASKLKDLGVQLPKSLNMVMCRRSTEVFLNDGKISEIFNFLDMNQVATIPDGINSVLPEDESLEKLEPMIAEFQSGCITHCINQILLRDYAASVVSSESRWGGLVFWKQHNFIDQIETLKKNILHAHAIIINDLYHL